MHLIGFISKKKYYLLGMQVSPSDHVITRVFAIDLILIPFHNLLYHCKISVIKNFISVLFIELT